MSTHALGRRTHSRVGVRLGLSAHRPWLAGGFVVAFALPFLLADVLERSTATSTASVRSPSSA
jgi:hypothetical protein